MMRTIVRSIAVLAFTTGLVVACGAAAAPTPAATPALTPAAATATPAPPNPTGTSVATPTAAPSVGPMHPAYVSGTGTLSQTSPGTTTPDGDCTRVDGAVVEATGTNVVEATGTNTDPRVTGATRLTLSGLDCGGAGFMWGKMSLTTANGSWEGTCTGGTWAHENNGDLSCWLVGSGAYKGLTYYTHSRFIGESVAGDGVILPAAPPTAP
jgi:hypothetical protein